jgi:succinoglycan biosynthesis transport protein ExoP
MARQIDGAISPSPTTSSREEEFDIKQIFMVLRRRLGVITGTVFVLTSFAWILALNLTPEYTATSTIIVEPFDSGLISFDNSRRPQDTQNEPMINTHVQELTSNFFARKTIERLNLLNHVEFAEALGDRDEGYPFGMFDPAEFTALVSEAFSWAKTHLIAIGLAKQPPPSDQELPVLAKPHMTQEQEGRKAAAALETPSQGPGEAKMVAGHHPTQLNGGEGLTELDRLRMIVQGTDLSGASLAARAAGFVSDHSFKEERRTRTRDDAGEPGDVSVLTSSREQEGGSAAAVVDPAREALIAEGTEFFLDRLSVSAANRSYAISVGFTSVDPETAAEVANTMADLFVENQLESKRIAASGTLDWLAGRLNELRVQLVEAEKVAGVYRENNQLLASGRGLAFDDRELAVLSEELIRARAERLATEAKLRRIKELRSTGESLDDVPEVLLSPYIVELRAREMDLLRDEAQLRQEYGPLHPNVITIQGEKDKLTARIDAEIQRVIGSIANQIATTQVREETLRAKLEEAKVGSLQTRRAEIQLRILEREAESTRTLYASFLDRFKQLTEQRELLEPGARIISKAAVPTEPSFPKVRLMTGAGFMGSLMFAVLLAFVVDRLDGGLRTGRQAEAALSVPTIGLIPTVGRAVRGRGPHLYLARKPISPYAEAIRSVQTALYFSNVDRPPQVVLVTSSLPAEGKTTLALSLAALLAASGHRTVLLDLDLRAPALGRRLGKPKGGDLIDYMKGHKELDEILHEVDHVDNLDVIRTRRLAGSPTDLLASQRMAGLVADLRDRYQYVILDSPPLLGMSDAVFAAHLADASVFVVRWSKTGEEVAQRALAVLRGSSTRVAGAVLTQVNVRRQRKYSPAEVAHYYGRYAKYYVH